MTARHALLAGLALVVIGVASAVWWHGSGPAPRSEEAHAAVVPEPVALSPEHSLRPEPYISKRESLVFLEEAIGAKSANAQQMDLDDARAWARIGWNDPLRPALYYLHCGGMFDSTEAEEAALQAILDRHEQDVLTPLRKEFFKGLVRVGDTLVARGEWHRPQRSVRGGLRAAPYNGSWQIFQDRRGFDETILLQIFAGEDPETDALFDEIEIALDAAFWEIGEFLRDNKKE